MEGSIFADLAAACSDAFQQCVPGKNSVIDEWFENRSADFNLWKAGLGASLQDHASLDWRLRNRPDVRDAIADLLEELKDSLDSYLDAPEDIVDTSYGGDQSSSLYADALAIPERPRSGDSNPGSVSPWSELSNDEIRSEQHTVSHSDDPLSTELFRSIDVTLDQLTRISAAVRKSGSRLRYEKADRTLDPSMHQELVEHLTLIILWESKRDIGSLMPTWVASEATTPSLLLSAILVQISNPIWLSAIQRRLIAANVRRRHRFLWARLHEQRRIGVASIDRPAKDPQKAAPSRQQERRSASSVARSQEKHTKPAIGHEKKSAETDDSLKSATEIGSRLAVPATPSTRAASVVTKVSATGKRIDYPPPPRLEGDRRTFECPYCHQGLPVKYAKKGWRGHVLQDIRPYVCLFENCAKEHELFISSEDWLEHMNEDHAERHWICSICASNHKSSYQSSTSTSSMSRKTSKMPSTLQKKYRTTSSKIPADVPDTPIQYHVFTSETALVNHLKNATEHEDNYTEEQISVITKKSLRRKPLRIATCPLCQSTVDESAEGSALIDHIAKHIHEFALRALPWDQVNDDNRKSAEAQKSAGDLSSANSMSSLREDNLTKEQVSILLRTEVTTTERQVYAILPDANAQLMGFRKTFAEYLTTINLRTLRHVQENTMISEEMLIRCIASIRRFQQLLDDLKDRGLRTLSAEQLLAVYEQFGADFQIITETSLLVAEEGLAAEQEASRHEPGSEVEASRRPFTTTNKRSGIHQYGLSEVSTVAVPLVELVSSYIPLLPDKRVLIMDIVFVHGLNGHPHDTWATTKPTTFWPGDLLPDALEEQSVRVLTYGYDANVESFTDGSSQNKIQNHAKHLAARLVTNRSLRKAVERPIIFVAHSLGGLLVKQCLLHCESMRHAQTEGLRSIYISTYGILFFGTPHLTGYDRVKWGSTLQSLSASVLPKKFFDSSPQLIKALNTNNDNLPNINRSFVAILPRFRVFFFNEAKPTDLKGTRVYVVDEESAAPSYEGVERMSIERSHVNMCKFYDEDTPGYDVVVEALQRYAEDAPRIIRARWEAQPYLWKPALGSNTVDTWDSETQSLDSAPASPDLNPLEKDEQEETVSNLDQVRSGTEIAPNIAKWVQTGKMEASPEVTQVLQPLRERALRDLFAPTRQRPGSSSQMSEYHNRQFLPLVASRSDPGIPIFSLGETDTSSPKLWAMSVSRATSPAHSGVSSNAEAALAALHRANPPSKRVDDLRALSKRGERG